MKNYSPRKLAVLISLVFTLICVVLMLSCRYIPSQGYIIATVLVSIGIFAICLVALEHVLKKYIIEKLTPLYSTIESLKEDEKDMKLDESDIETATIISEVNEEVAKWAKDRTREIALLKANEKYRKEFLGNVSHELKTPLFNIQGYILTLVDGGLEDEAINMKYLERAEKNINRLISIVEDLEVISKFESGELKLNIEDFDISAVVQEIFELYEMKAKDRNITLKFVNKPHNPVMVRADKTRIFEVISNLVVNSINYGHDNGTTSIGLYDIETKWLIEVQDNGIGIEESQLQRIFERFFRVDKSRSSQNGGTGLGLAIVKHILEAHGEIITVKSKINEGTTFSFTLKKAE